MNSAVLSTISEYLLSVTADGLRRYNSSENMIGCVCCCSRSGPTGEGPVYAASRSADAGTCWARILNHLAPL